MKKFIVLALAVCVSLAGFSQIATCTTLAAGDTVVNTATVNKVISTTGNNFAAGVQIKITKISGTVAGTTKLQGTINGTDYEDIGSAYTNLDQASQTKTFTVTGGVPYVKLRTTTTGSGTMSASITICYVLKKLL